MYKLGLKLGRIRNPNPTPSLAQKIFDPPLPIIGPPRGGANSGELPITDMGLVADEDGGEGFKGHVARNLRFLVAFQRFFLDG